jgi:hypothetical protein
VALRGVFGFDSLYSCGLSLMLDGIALRPSQAT